MLQHLNIRVYGTVQGVGFRFSADRKAEELGIKGFVQNASDGTAYIEAEGEKEELEKFLAWCKSGPSFSKVDRIETEPGELKNFSKFRII